MDKYLKKVSELVLTPIRKILCIEISSAVIFHGRELNLVSKCRHMNKLSCGKKINGGWFGKKGVSTPRSTTSKPIYINLLCLCTFRSGTFRLIIVTVITMVSILVTSIIIILITTITMSK